MFKYVLICFYTFIRNTCTDASKRLLCNHLMEAQSGHECQKIKGVWLLLLSSVWFRKQRPGSEGRIRSSATCSVAIPSYCCYDTKGVTHSYMNHIISRRTQQAPSLLTVHLSSYAVRFATLLYTVLKHFRANSFYLYYVSLTHPLFMVTPLMVKDVFWRLGAFLPQCTTWIYKKKK